MGQGMVRQKNKNGENKIGIKIKKWDSGFN